jgi:hypothetical protein
MLWNAAILFIRSIMRRRVMIGLLDILAISLTNAYIFNFFLI